MLEQNSNQRAQRQYSNNSTRYTSSNQNRSSRVSASSQTKKPAGRKLDAHEYELVRAKREGLELHVELMSGIAVKGKLVDFDRFSLVLELNELGETSKMPVFKHAMESFRVLNTTSML